MVRKRSRAVLRATLYFAVAHAAIFAAACGDSPVEAGSEASLEVAIAPLDLPEGLSACYDLRTKVGAVAGGEPVCTTAGDAAPTLAVLACDPGEDVDPERPGAQSEVVLTFAGVRDADGAVDERWLDPCPGGCRLAADCDNAGPARVDVDLTLARRDERGFFDAGLAVDGMVCSARYDCAAGVEGDVAGEPVARHLLGFACVGDLDARVDPVLYLDPVVVTCDDGWGPMTATFDPAAADGVDADPTTSEDAPWPGVAFTNRFDRLQRVSAREGTVDGQRGLTRIRTRYWNVELAFRGDLAGCRLTTRGTMDDATRLGGAAAGVVLPDQVYPYVDWSIALGGCSRDHLIDRPQSGVSTRYFTGGEVQRFSHSAPWGYASCAANAECPGAVCVDGGCQAVSALGGACDEVTDCVEGASCAAGVCVRPPLRITPSTVSVPVGGESTFEALGGEGGYSFELVAGPGRLDGATYIAPVDREGTAVVRVRDLAGEVREATVTVAGEPLALAPSAIWVAVGESRDFSASGGIPPYRYAVVAGEGTIDPESGRFSASEVPGDGMVRVTDARGDGAVAVFHVTSP